MPTTRQQLSDPKPVLKAGSLYIADNGRVICTKCAGQSALYTGYDISGQRVQRMRPADVREFAAAMGEDTVSCEAGCTTLQVEPA